MPIGPDHSFRCAQTVPPSASLAFARGVVGETQNMV